MYGSGLGNLTISATPSGGQPSQLVSIKGQDVAQDMLRWEKMTVSVVGSTTMDDWVIVIGATVGKPGQGDIAIDDIVFSPHCMLKDVPKCKDGEFECVNGNCISSYHVCDFTNDCEDNSDEATCPDTFTFEVSHLCLCIKVLSSQSCPGLCGWSLGNPDMESWSKATPETTASSAHGPKEDASGKTTGMVIRTLLHMAQDTSSM